MSVHTFSVVIATRNRQALLAKTLDALARQDWPADRTEIIVADNGSTDATAQVVEAAARRRGAPLVRTRRVDRPGKSFAVNEGLALASGDLVALTDDDVVAEREWLTNLARAFDETEADFVAGRVVPAWEVPPPSWLSSRLYGVLAVPDNGLRRLPIDARSHDIMPIGANMAVRRAVVTRVGGLSTSLGKLAGTLRTGEDHEWFLRMLDAGLRGTYEPTAVVHHHVPRERLERSYFRRWMLRNGRDVAQLEQSYPNQAIRLFGVPRYLWRQAAGDAASAAAAAMRGQPARRFASSARLLWFAGYTGESWTRSWRRLPTAGPSRRTRSRTS